MVKWEENYRKCTLCRKEAFQLNIYYFSTWVNLTLENWLCTFVMSFFFLHTLCVCVWLQKELPRKTDCPHMCAYKLVTVKFKWWGLQNKVENFIQKVRPGATNRHFYLIWYFANSASCVCICIRVKCRWIKILTSNSSNSSGSIISAQYYVTIYYCCNTTMMACSWG